MPLFIIHLQDMFEKDSQARAGERQRGGGWGGGGGRRRRVWFIG